MRWSCYSFAYPANKICVNCSNCGAKKYYANASKLLDLNQLSPISLLMGINLAWICYQKVTEQLLKDRIR